MSDASPPKNESNLAAIALCALVVIVIAYFGTYFALLEEKKYFTVVLDRVTTVPAYRVNGAGIDFFLWPAHWVDRQIRPSVWQFNMEEFSQGARSKWRGLSFPPNTRIVVRPPTSSPSAKQTYYEVEP